MIHIPGEENQLVLCPYDKSHNIRLARMQVHLIKCRRNHQDQEKAQCPFNVTHVVNKVELDVHIKICPQRMGFESFRQKDEFLNESMIRYEESAGGTSKNCEGPIAKKEDSECSWDITPVPSYNPEAYSKSAPVLRQPRGLTPSERRKFRANERERLREME